MIKFVDLFCGMGSFTYSLGKLGCECVMACDIDPNARLNYYNHFGEEPLGDIKDIDPATLPQYDLLCAGIPCQAFSKIGKQQGFDDERGTLFFTDVMRFIKTNQPRLVLIENVPSLLSNKEGASMSQVVSTLSGAGYRVDYKILTCSDYGIPQRRRRLFIFGHRADQPEKPSILRDLEPYRKDVTLSQFFGRGFEKRYAYTVRTQGWGSKMNPTADGKYARHNWDGYIVDGEVYRLSYEDLLALQGFEDYELSGNQLQKYRLLGNTIPTVLTHVLGSELIKKFCA